MASRSGPSIPDPTRPRRKNTLPRADLAPGDCLCNHCAGKCCRYFSLPIDTPTRRADFDTIRGYLEHGQTLVYFEKGVWYLVVMTRCRYLLKDDRCGIYFNRPKICQDYSTNDCEYDDDWIFPKVFETPEQVDEYADAILPARKGAKPVDDPPRTSKTFSLVIETPLRWDDYDAIRWYLAHGQTLVYVEKGRWYLVVGTNLGETCEDRGFDRVFETPEQLWEYAEAVLPPRRRPKGTGPTINVISNPPTD